MTRVLLLVFLFVGLQGCGESGHEHFCSKYQYLHGKLTEPGVLPFMTLKRMLRQELNDPAKRDDAKMALFVISDIERGVIRESEEPRDYCLRRKRWESYR
ncbi:hypothetical protein [Pseudoteredinibacter isoporae]|uniref:Lipoprotein n=1 Tax=Pseudoteredinibacter isoporae TaxID=570281 RepID=A0A7X0MWP8_9GAMM|nr:hypothetical protein [Pseudoteredinibacter isoporae]MBB6521179.1 hypothetical protein [Pseudoteredinibacter isoporae]NHO86739.1 hypothetical protein [Pseudoteredinibacter isoporae]NIB24809.1 hypothetical protein [Pseudoteredinibacter isoporae]